MTKEERFELWKKQNPKRHAALVRLPPSEQRAFNRRKKKLDKEHAINAAIKKGIEQGISISKIAESLNMNKHSVYGFMKWRHIMTPRQRWGRKVMQARQHARQANENRPK